MGGKIARWFHFSLHLIPLSTDLSTGKGCTMSVASKFKLFKRSNGIYYIIQEEAGKKQYRSTHSTLKSEALKALAECRHLFADKCRPMLLSSFISDFLRYAEGTFSKGTVTIYRSALENFKACAGDILLASITARHFDHFKVARLRKRKPVTINIDLRALRAAFNTAVRWKLLDTSPFQGVKLVPVEEQVPTFFTRVDFEKLIGLIKENWLRELTIFAVLTGLRRGEICNLKWEHVDIARRFLRIQSSATFRTKHGKMRIVPLSDPALRLIQQRFSKSPSEYVFTLKDAKMSESWVSHKFKWYVYEAKLNNDALHFHSLRHTFASWLVQAGTSIFEVQKLLGHSDIKVTQVYAHLQPETLYAAVNKIALSLN